MNENITELKEKLKLLVKKIDSSEALEPEKIEMLKLVARISYLSGHTEGVVQRYGEILKKNNIDPNKI